MNKSAFIMPLSGTLSEVRQQMREAKSYIKLFECRLDLIEFNNLDEVSTLLKSSTKPYMLTLKPEKADQLATLWQWANHLNPAYIDIDVRYIQMLKSLPKTKAQLIISSHNETPCSRPIKELADLKAKAPKDATIKLVVNFSGTADLFDLLSFLKKDNKDQLRSMFLFKGLSGRFLRLLAPLYATQLSFVSFDEKSKTDPGQLTCLELESLYSPMLELKPVPFFALLGRPTVQSKGPLFHNERFYKAGAKAIYTSIDLSDKAFLPFIEKAKAEPFFKGFSITMPFKNSLGLSEPINTLVLEKGQWSAFNTDGLAALYLLKEKGLKKGELVAILGTGGTALAIAKALNLDGIETVFISRAKKGRLNGCNIYSYSELESIDYNALIQATPAGFNGLEFELPLKGEQFRKGAIYFECVQATKTPFLEKAEKAGGAIIYGHELFLRQGTLQSERFISARGKAISSKACSYAAFSS